MKAWRVVRRRRGWSASEELAGVRRWRAGGERPGDARVEGRDAEIDGAWRRTPHGADGLGANRLCSTTTANWRRPARVGERWWPGAGSRAPAVTPGLGQCRD
jgi:hypothetical protein